MNILFTIYGRASSKGIKNRNLRMICGKPLACFSVSAIDLYLHKHPEVNVDCVVNSDSMELIEQLKRNSRMHFEDIVRNNSLAGDSVGKMMSSMIALKKCRREWDTAMKL